MKSSSTPPSPAPLPTTSSARMMPARHERSRPTLFWDISNGPPCAPTVTAPPFASRSSGGIQMEPILVPEPPKKAFNKGRLISDLVRHQVEHFKHVEESLPPDARAKIP